MFMLLEVAELELALFWLALVPEAESEFEAAVVLEVVVVDVVLLEELLVVTFAEELFCDDWLERLEDARFSGDSGKDPKFRKPLIKPRGKLMLVSTSISTIGDWAKKAFDPEPVEKRGIEVAEVGADISIRADTFPVLVVVVVVVVELPTVLVEEVLVVSSVFSVRGIFAVA